MVENNNEETLNLDGVVQKKQLRITLATWIKFAAGVLFFTSAAIVVIMVLAAIQ